MSESSDRDASLPTAAVQSLEMTPQAATALVALATSLGLEAIRVDLTGCEDKAGLLERIAAALGFPDWFGDNWDALRDCLTDLTWRKARGYIIVLERCEAFAQAARGDFETALELFRLVADDWRESHVPFWVLIGGTAAEEFGLPDLVQV